MYAYLFGQILGTHSFYLKNGFLKPDEYSELSAVYFLPGGETGSAATVLSSLGVNVKMDGTHIGTEVAPMLRDFYKDKSVDISSLYFDPDYKGLMDYVVVADLVRSPMGTFQTLYESGEKRWNMPKEADIEGCCVAAIDPFFMEETEKAAELCVKHNKPYVTIDCAHTEYLHRHSAIDVISKECLAEHYKGMEREKVYELMAENTDGLVIITAGEKDMIYGRKGQKLKRMKPFDVDVKSTLGAGDTFKAACVYGLMNGLSDDELVRFASATSAVAISRYPLPLKPPTLEEVKALI
ncbi:MAG: carbohydrate kinase family protein [Lachnospiraceae bacterium]|nr:carbohydrate kinase family protein [Lachnospiraceae bacterium]